MPCTLWYSAIPCRFKVCQWSSLQPRRTPREQTSGKESSCLTWPWIFPQRDVGQNHQSTFCSPCQRRGSSPHGSPWPPLPAPCRAQCTTGQCLHLPFTASHLRWSDYLEQSLSYRNMHKFLISFLFQLKFMHTPSVFKSFLARNQWNSSYQTFIHTRR